MYGWGRDGGGQPADSVPVSPTKPLHHFTSEGLDEFIGTGKKNMYEAAILSTCPAPNDTRPLSDGTTLLDVFNLSLDLACTHRTLTDTSKVNKGQMDQRSAAHSPVSSRLSPEARGHHRSMLCPTSECHLLDISGITDQIHTPLPISRSLQCDDNWLQIRSFTLPIERPILWPDSTDCLR